MNEIDEVVLVERAQRGERAAFEELVRRSSKVLFARVYLETGGDRALAEDLVQETYLSAFRAIERMSDVKGFRAWLYTIARNVVIDDTRKRTRKKRSDGTAKPQMGNTDLQSVADRSPGPVDVAEMREQRVRVLEALSAMPEEYRMPLLLRYLHGANYDAIAKQLALSNGSLRGLLQRGMAMLKQRLDEPGRTP